MTWDVAAILGLAAIICTNIAFDKLETIVIRIVDAWGRNR